MNVQHCIQLLKEGKSLKKISEEIGVSPRTLSRYLQSVGIVFNKIMRCWEFNVPKGDLEKEILIKPNEQVPPLTDDEVLKLRVLIQSIPNHLSFNSIIDLNLYTIHQAINSKVLHTPNKIRRTYGLSNDILVRFEALADSKRLYRSDLVELAIIEMLEKYDWR
ncbi:hypothetical protein V1503_23505 [Bacillus sp. SCS-151]|uniref:hypothetical protein n=1 Tax=Nanhaiella sioensis TaxID=3115293 RepID=UPI00397D9441